MSGSFLSRWARRKESVRAAERSETPAVADAAGAENLLDGTPSPGASDNLQRAEARTDDLSEAVSDDLLAKLPSLDALTTDTDLSAFLQAGVPTALRNAALRRMWSLDPAIRDFVSEARDYAYDWNTPGGVPGTGPLLPIDDVKAMLKRVIDGVPTGVDEAAGPESQGVPAASQDDPAACASAADPEPEAIPGPVPAAPSIDMHPQVADLAGDRPEVAQPALPRPRLRRHGGAMPS
ncbi:DUF3306 domain-containing protein [Methylorubrum podarium]|uniref:DUF3306 domain-containing protein n=1 Tax=Methylorubrum podarium TaxID=200476 RepID=UPI001EE2C246|nr:DUF3306 domain-containing protein [Methylorubrum podarium]GJE69093.1 hypothetical protein CHKEEEPN_0616 [Methylorubrum podarium]